MDGFKTTLLAFCGLIGGLLFGIVTSAKAINDRLESTDNHMYRMGMRLDIIRGKMDEDAKKIEKLEVQAELARAEANRQKGKADGLEAFFAEMYKMGVLPLIPESQIPPTKLPTKPID